MDIGCFELCVPGDNLVEKLDTLEASGMWIELAIIDERKDFEILNSHSVKAESVQAYNLHSISLISPDSGTRKNALKHVKETIDIANNVGAKRVITVPTYGQIFMASPFKMAVNIFREISVYAQDSGIEILVEALSQKKTSFLPSINEVADFVNTVSSENLGLLADTGHLYDIGVEIISIIQDYAGMIKEIHLKSVDSRPPTKDIIPAKEIVNSFKQIPQCLEYKTNDPSNDFKEVLKNLVYPPGLNEK